MSDRRQDKRHDFSATAEIVDMISGAQLSTRAADLNQGGCYLDLLNPLPIGTNVRVRITWDGEEFTCIGVVRDSQPGMGMGVAFMDLDDARMTLIKNWIERMGSPARDLSPSPLLKKTNPALPSDQKDDLAVRLVDLMHKKGLLSSNEVASLLRDRIL